MNKVFRVIWNHATQTWVAVSELQSAKGKTKSSTKAIVTAVAGLFAVDAMAATVVVPTSTGVPTHTKVTTTNTIDFAKNSLLSGLGAAVAHDANVNKIAANNLGNDNIVIGENAYSASTGSIVLGKNAIGGTVNGYGTMAHLHPNELNRYGANSFYAMNTVAIGTNSTAGADQAVAIGNNAKAASNRNSIPGGVAIGGGAYAQDQFGHLLRGNPYNPLETGTYAHPIFNNYDTDDTTNKMGLVPNTSGQNRVDIDGDGNYSATYDQTPSTALGYKAFARGGGTVMGALSAAHDSGVALGSLALAKAVGSMALGNEVYAGGNTAIAMGRQSAATEDYSLAFGNVAAASGKGSVAMGHSANASGYRAIAIGSPDILGAEFLPSKTNKNTPFVQFGPKYQQATQTLASGIDALALGATARATDSQANAIGAASEARAEHSTAIGFEAVSEGKRSTAIGSTAYTNGDASAAIAQNARAVADKSLSIGVNTKSLSNSAVAIGANAIAGSGQITNAQKQQLAAAEKKVEDARKAILAQEAKVATKAKEVNDALSLPLAEFNAIAEQYKAEQKKLADLRVALNTVKQEYATLNNNLSAGGSPDAVAIGRDALAASAQALAVGVETKVSAAQSGAFGYRNEIGTAGVGSYAMGQNNVVNKTNTFVVGNGVTPTQENSVVLGNQSTDRAATTEAQATVGGVTYGNFAGQGAASKGVVSVGAAGNERQIINVAAGNISATSTDAINGSQLYMVMDKIIPAKNTTLDDQKPGALKQPDQTEGPRFVNSNVLVDAINKAGWNVDIGATEGGTNKDGNKGEKLVTPGNTVKFIAGKGIDISRNDKEITISATIDPADFAVQVDGTTIKKEGDVLKANTSPIDVDSTQSDGNKPTFTTAQPNALATAGDVKTVAEKLVTEGLDFTGNNDDVTVHRDLGTKLTVKGGHDANEVSDKNVYVKADAESNSLIVNIAEKPEFKEVKLDDGNGNNVSLTPTKGDTLTLNGDDNNPVKIDNVTSGLKPYEPTTHKPANDKDPKQPAPNKGAEDLVNLNTPDVSNNTAATVGDLRNMGWVVATPDNQYEHSVKNAEKVNFKGSDGINVKGKTNADGIYDVEFSLAAASKIALENTPKSGGQPEPTGKVTLPDGDTGNGFVSANTVINAINNSGWKATSGKVDGGEAEGTTSELINPGETVTYQAGKNMKVKQEGNVFTYATKDDVKFKSVNIEGSKAGNKGVTMTSTEPNTLNLGGGDVNDGNISPVTVTGVAGNLPDTYNKDAVNKGGKPVTQSQDLPAGVENKVNNAATVGDVLNAGWNLKNNGDAKDFVKPYDTVNFVNGQSTTAKVTTNPDGKSSDVTFDVDLVKLDMEKEPVDPAKPNQPQQPTGKVVVPVDANGKPSKAIATAADVANAINNAGWKATIGRDDSDFNDQTGKTTKLIKAGDTVTYKAGKNLRVKQDGNDITYALSNDVDLGPNGSIKAGPVKIDNKGINAGNTRITNVAPGKAPTDAVNVSQLKGAINQVNKGYRAGVAGANAAAGLPQVYIPGKSMVAASAGTFRGQSALAVGYSRASDNGKLLLKIQGNTNTQGDIGGSVGVGYQW